ncbi:hypothetical protein Ahy_A10g047673 isoform B [Arachis hypogaea]|uniref:Uncharacterized protein n=1 Tax=Arachis hypogaea TaxID=3818 RepID=A0A445B370_ARAHY|nr:hypothetical protein Ahy_A10g047673 isoform B [Arachis hypogaea]
MMDGQLRTFASSYWVLFQALRIDSHRRSELSNSHGFTIPSVESWSMTPLSSACYGTREDAFDSRVHIRWLPLLEDLDRCGRLS